MSNRRSTIRLLAPGLAAGLAIGLLTAPPAHADFADIDLGDSAGVRIDGATAGEISGYRVAGVGDTNGDGTDDVIIGAPNADRRGRSDSGSVYVVFGGSGSALDLGRLRKRGFRIDGAAAGDQVGTSVAGAGDVNGDGFADLLVGAPSAGNNSRAYSGSTYVVFGSSRSANVDLQALATLGFRIDGGAPKEWSGSSVAGAGDLNGDGLDDVIIGAPNADGRGRSTSGSAYVVFGSVDAAPVDLADAVGRGFRIDGATTRDRAGTSVANAGDVNGDGRNDLLVGAPNHGAAYVVFTGSAADVDLAVLGQRGFRIDGAFSKHYNNHALAGIGDVNGDGLDDVLVGSHLTVGGPGAFAVFGGNADSVDRSSLGERGYLINGGSAGRAGKAVAGAGDVNADGIPDLLVGAPYADKNKRRYSGSSYVVFGGSSDPADLDNLADRGLRIDGAAVGEHSGASVAGSGDFNGDGVADMLIGAFRADAKGRKDSGSTYVVFGGEQARLKVRARGQSSDVAGTGRTKLVRSIRVGKGQKARVTVKALPKKARRTVTVKRTKHRVVVRTRKTPKSARIRVRIASRGPGYLTKTWSRTWRMVGAAKSAPTTQAQSPLLLALGDSWAGGFGDREWGGYVNRLYDDLQTQKICTGPGQSSRPVKCDALEVRNISRGGATSASVLSDQLQKAVDLLQQRNGDRNPTNDVVVTAVTVGGLDVFQPVLQACAGGVSDQCKATIEQVFASYETNMTEILAALRAAAGTRTKIVVTAYGNPIPYCYVGGFGLGPLAAAILEGDRSLGVPVGLNDITRRVAADYDVGVAETFRSLGAGDWVGDTDCLHPDASGHEKVAGAFLKALGLKATGPGHVRVLQRVVKNGKVQLTWKKARRAKRYEVRITQPGGTKYLKWAKQKNRAYVRKVVKGKKYRAQIRGLGAGGRGPITTVTFRNG